MSDANPPVKPKEVGDTISRIIIGIISGFATSYILNHLSLAGVDFKVLGIDSEIVKSAIEGTLIGVVSAPKNFIYSLRDGILFIRWSLQTLWDAAAKGKRDNLS